MSPMPMEATAVAAVTFKRENVKPLWDEIVPLARAHWDELADYKDLSFAPNKAFYVGADEAGALRIFTIRETGVLIGYCVFVVQNHPHSGASIYATQDVIFIRKDKRGRLGARFIQWCDQQLAREKVAVVLRQVHTSYDFGSMLSRVGYMPVGLIYAKRLGVED